jgi:hypothetical protein
MASGESPARSVSWPERSNMVLSEASAATRPEMQLKRVVLPAPLGPMTAVMRPAGTDSDTFCTALNPMKSFETFVTARTGRITQAVLASLRVIENKPCG